MKIKKNDKVLVIKGKYRGKTGVVLKAMPKQNRVIVEGVNIVKKRIKPRKSGEKGKVLEVTAPIFTADLKLICKKCKKAARVGYKIILEKGEKKKIRFCKKCAGET